MPAADLALRARAELALREHLTPLADAPRETFDGWIRRTCPGWSAKILAHRHVGEMVETAQAVVDGEITRLLVSAPPRYYKSLVWARWLPGYYLSRLPAEWVAVVSASATLAEIMSGDAREFFRASGARFRTDSQDKSLWRTTKGGGMWARGVGGWALGVGYNLGIIDDPFASWSEAMKENIQLAVEEYFWKTFFGRREISGDRPAAIVVNHQGLAEGDLRGRILKREMEAKLPSEGWHVLNLPAIKRARREPFPPSVTVIPDSRAEGEPLCPELQGQDIEGLLLLEASDRNLFAATHQQEPLPDQGGGMFERWWWSLACSREQAAEAEATHPELTQRLLALMESGAIPLLHREARAWDIAASVRGEGDASASVRGGVAMRRALQEIIFTDAQEYYYPAHSVLDLIFETACQDGTGVEVILPQEPAGAGKIMIANLKLRLENAGFTVVVVSTSGSKRVRANPHAGAAAPLRNAAGEEDGRMGRCLLVPGDWNTLFIERHHKFDGVTKPLDLVDAAAYLFSELDGSSFLTSGIR